MRVLIAEDDSVSRHVLGCCLAKWGYDAVVTTDGKEAWEVLRADDGPRLAILDWMMPGLDGVELCRMVRASANRSYVYIILLTALHREEDVVRGMEAGADDFVSKPFHPNELRVRLRAGERILDLQGELTQTIATLKSERAKLAHLSRTDDLTGLANRRHFDEVLRSEWARAQRDKQVVSLLMTDVDCFKRYNDTYGHQAGDLCLSSVALAIRRQVTRPFDLAARHGGEEFAVILPSTPAEGARQVAELVRAEVESLGLPHAASHVADHVTVSVGVASVVPQAAVSPEDLIRRADEALYLAKLGGRNRSVLHAGDPVPSVREVAPVGTDSGVASSTDG